MRKGPNIKYQHEISQHQKWREDPKNFWGEAERIRCQNDTELLKRNTGSYHFEDFQSEIIILTSNNAETKKEICFHLNKAKKKRHTKNKNKAKPAWLSG